MRRTVRAAAKVVGLGVLALALAGCIKLDMDLKVASDDTVDGTVVFAMNKDILELTGQPADALLEDAGGLPTDVVGVSAEPYEDDNFAGTQLTFDAVPLEEFNSQSDADSLNIVREGDEFRVSGVLDMSGATDTGTEGQPFEDVAGQALSSAEIRIAVTFPGEVISANGDVSGNTVVWEPEFGERLEVEAIGSAIDSGGGLPWIPIIAILGVLVVAAAAVAIVLSRRGGRPAPATAGVQAAGAEMAGEGGAASADEGPATETSTPTQAPAIPEPPPAEAPEPPPAGEETHPAGEPPERPEGS